MPATVATYTTLPGTLGGPLSQRRSGQSRFYLPDHQGNTRQLTNAAESTTDTLLADAWGVEIASSGTSVNSFRSFGQWGYYRDSALRVYVRRRSLGVKSGIWLTRDPLEFQLIGNNLYRYVDNQPTSSFDPSGMVPQVGPGCDCMPKSIQSDINKCLNEFCSAWGANRNKIRDCADSLVQAGAGTRKQVESCFEKLCGSNKIIPCKGTDQAGQGGEKWCERESVIKCGAACGPPIDRRVPTCAYNSGLIVPPDPINQKLVFCCYWFTNEIDKDCPDPATDSTKRFIERCRNQQNFVLFHELAHTCGALSHQNQPQNQFAECVLGKIDCARSRK